MRFFVLSILVILFFMLISKNNIVFAQSVSPTPTIETIQQTQYPQENNKENDIVILQTKVDDLEYLIKSQTVSYNATISRWEANLNLILVIIGIASVFVVLLGYGFVKEFINKTVATRLKSITQDEIDKAINEEVSETRKKYDPKFASLYDEYKKSVGK